MKNKLPFEFVEACQDDLKEVQNFLQPYMDRNELLQRTSIEMELLLKNAFPVSYTHLTLPTILLV